MGAPVPIVTVTRDGFVEALHLGHVAVADEAGALLGGLGDPAAIAYPRSALKPLQALAALEMLAEHGCDLDPMGVAIACGSHDGSAAHQVEAAHLLARAGLDEQSLRCPPARPRDDDALDRDAGVSVLAHNCSGKHAAFLLAQTVAGGAPGDYLDPACGLQRRVRDVIERVAGTPVEGPAVDGCGAPAWRMPLASVARAFARLASSPEGLEARVREAMVAFPHLVGGGGTADTEMMCSQVGLIAKRGAEGVIAAGWLAPEGPRGVAVKVADGAARAATTAAAEVLAGMGACVPDELREPPVLGGGRPCGRIEPTAQVRELAARCSRRPG